MRLSTRAFACLFSGFAFGALATTLTLTSAIPASAALEERVGVLEVYDVFLEPQFRYFETRNGGFEAGNSLISFRWLRDESVSAVVTAGTDQLVGRPRRYRGGSEAGLALAEAYVETRSSLGDVRFGRVPLPFGTESGRGEARLRLPRAMVHRAGYLGLRDQGLSYAIENRGFSSEWAVHNGEGGPDLDNQIWFTSRWGWQGGDGLSLGFSGSAGRTTPLSTQDAALSRSEAVAGLDPDRSSKQRFGNAFVEWDARPLGVVLEGTFGESEQAGSIRRLRSGHLDLFYALSRRWGLLARYDVLDPDGRVRGDRQDEATLGVSLGGAYGTSTVYVLGTRAHLQGAARARHEAMLIWRLTPLARGPR